jgi:radical SAM protein with 4Fe4S-binding SPASM domain
MCIRDRYPAVATNGWMFANPAFLEKAKKAGLRYMEVSVDSADPKKHDEFRGRKGSWERATKALQNAVKMGINHAMATTVTKYNIDEIEDMLDLAESLGVKRVIFFNFVPTGRGEEIIDMDLDPIEREEFLRTIYREMKKRKIEIESTAPEYGRVTLQMSGNQEIAPTHFYVGGDPVVKSLAEFIGGCGAGRIYAALDPDGTVMPCVFLRIKVGNIREKSFREIWATSPLMRKLRDRNNLWGFCRDCPFREICGGCRARAYSYYGDPLAPDPGCIYNIGEWKKLREQILESKKIEQKVVVKKK